MQTSSAFLQFEFALLILLSFVLPIRVYVVMYRKTSIARRTLVILALALIVMSGADFVLLQRLADVASQTPTHADDWIFSSQLSIALYLVPAIFTGIGMNLLTQVLITPLAAKAERCAESDKRAK